MNHSVSSSFQGKEQEEERILEYDTSCCESISETKTDSASNNIGKQVYDTSETKTDFTIFQETDVPKSSTLSRDTSSSCVYDDRKVSLCNDSTVAKTFIFNNDSLQQMEHSTQVQSNNTTIKNELRQEIQQKAEFIDEVNMNSCSDGCKVSDFIKIERIECNSENSSNHTFNKELHSAEQIVEIKQENGESTSINDVDDEEPTIAKSIGNRAIKTYSKKQNAAIDSENENESSWENADYRAWKKSIMLVYHRLSTNKYASIFLRPITEDQAPGYHSLIFKPMDLSTIKKNIDNGTIRSTSHFQRDVMLMFQNAIMFNKHNTFVHKMTLEMQEECLQHMQVILIRNNWNSPILIDAR